MRHGLLMMAALALMACAPTGGGGDDRPPAPMCPQIDWEVECPERGFPHVARQWSGPDGVVTTIDTKEPPEASWTVGVRVTTWCVMDPERPDSNRAYATTPSPIEAILGQNEWRADSAVGRFVAVWIDDESFKCADQALPAYEYTVRSAGAEARYEYPENVPVYEYCDGACELSSP